jgi:hypothetical protein
MDNNSSLLAGLGRMVDLDLKFDEHGEAFLLLDEQLMVSIRSQSTGVILHAMVAEFPETQSAEVWQNLLAINLTLAEANEGTLAYERRTETVLLVKYLPTEHLQQHAFDDAFERFVNQLEYVIASLDNARVMPGTQN